MSGGATTAQPFGAIAAELTKTRLSRKTLAKLERGDSPRSGEKVWRNSYYEGQIEDRLWKPINGGSKRGGARWVAAVLKTAKQMEYRTRLKRREEHPGCENGAIGTIGLEVLEYLCDLVDYTTGRLEPAIATIADDIGRSYAAVHAALVRLRSVGFLSWARRSKPVENPQPGGPQVQQITNAYALLVPKEAQGWIARLFRRGPPPDDWVAHREAQAAEFERMISSMTAVDYQAAFGNEDALLGPTLKRLAAMVDEREERTRESSSDGETGRVHRTL